MAQSQERPFEEMNRRKAFAENLQLRSKTVLRMLCRLVVKVSHATRCPSSSRLQFISKDKSLVFSPFSLRHRHILLLNYCLPAGAKQRQLAKRTSCEATSLRSRQGACSAASVLHCCASRGSAAYFVQAVSDPQAWRPHPSWCNSSGYRTSCKQIPCCKYH